MAGGMSERSRRVRGRAAEKMPEAGGVLGVRGGESWKRTSRLLVWCGEASERWVECISTVASRKDGTRGVSSHTVDAEARIPLALCEGVLLPSASRRRV